VLTLARILFAWCFLLKPLPGHFDLYRQLCCLFLYQISDHMLSDIICHQQNWVQRNTIYHCAARLIPTLSVSLQMAKAAENQELQSLKS